MKIENCTIENSIMDYFLHISVLAAIYSLAVLGQNYAAGYGGIISIQHGAFMGMGAYGLAYGMKTLGYSYPVSFFMAAVVTAFVAWLISFPLLKLKDDAFVLVSFGFSFIAYNVFLNWHSVTNGAIGLKGIVKPDLVRMFDPPALGYLIIVVGVLVVSVWVLHLIVKSSYGVIIRASRENQRVTQVSGHDTGSYRRSVFVLSAVLASFAGSFLASHISAIDPLLFNYHLSVLLLVMAILGGLASLKGSIVGAVLMILLPEVLRFVGDTTGTLLEFVNPYLMQALWDGLWAAHSFFVSHLAQFQQIIYGFILIGLMMYWPKGIFGRFRI